MSNVATLEAIVRDVVERHAYDRKKKSSKRLLIDALKTELSNAGFTIELEDAKRIIPSKLSCWRDVSGPVETKNRRQIDLVAYKDGALIALLESEEDLAEVRRDLRPKGYFVLSHARNSAGEHFLSYMSLERMAIAAALLANPPLAIDRLTFFERLTEIRSDVERDHNPLGVPLFLTLACGRADRGTEWRSAILEPRLQSIGCKLIAR